LATPRLGATCTLTDFNATQPSLGRSFVLAHQEHPAGQTTRGHRYAYRVRFLDAEGERKGRTFDSAQDALDFRGRLRLLKRAGDLAALDVGRESLEQFSRDYWRLYAEVRLAPRTEKASRCLWNGHIRKRLGGMQLRQITPLVVSQFISELQDAGVSVHSIRACLDLLQSMFSRAVEWDRAKINVVHHALLRKGRGHGRRRCRGQRVKARTLQRLNAPQSTWRLYRNEPKWVAPLRGALGRVEVHLVGARRLGVSAFRSGVRASRRDRTL
jgi:DNA-binding transcriptional MerR regulator